MTRFFPRPLMHLSDNSSGNHAVKAISHSHLRRAIQTYFRSMTRFKFARLHLSQHIELSFLLRLAIDA